MSTLTFSGTVLAVQPRIRLHRSFDQRHHSYQGYVLRLDGSLDGWDRGFAVATGEAAQVKHTFRAGDQITGEGEFIVEPRTEVADLYKAAKLKVVSRAEAGPPPGPPWLNVPPAGSKRPLLLCVVGQPDRPRALSGRRRPFHRRWRSPGTRRVPGWPLLAMAWRLALLLSPMRGRHAPSR